MVIEAQIAVTVVYSARPRTVAEQVLLLPQGCTVAQALRASGSLEGADQNGFAAAGQGVWGRKVPLTHVLKDQDRLEIYRPLTVDPKVARRERFVGQGAKKAAGLFAQRRAGAKAGY
jgi:putative ubiquitin-RnfH superfamily antitoxin RatB of RatAB toxin-antitoxin module